MVRVSLAVIPKTEMAVCIALAQLKSTDDSRFFRFPQPDADPGFHAQLIGPSGIGKKFSTSLIQPPDDGIIHAVIKDGGIGMPATVGRSESYTGFIVPARFGIQVGIDHHV